MSGYLCAISYMRVPDGVPHTCIANAAIPEGARLSNRINYFTTRPETFTVDERGFRNGPSHIVKHPRVVLIGSSFSFGMALSDDETFSRRLNEQLGDIVYNASRTLDTRLSADTVERTARTSGLAGGLIVMEVLNRASYSYVPPQEGSCGSRYAGLVDSGRLAVEPLMRGLAPLFGLAWRIRHASAVDRVSTLLNMRLHDEHILPNPYQSLYGEEQLVDGRKVLIYYEDRDFSRKPQHQETTAYALERFAADMFARGYRLAILLLPNSYSVYYPLMKNREAADASEDYMYFLSARLATAHVPVLNLLPVLRSAARTELSNGRLIYYPDNAHWNPKGCEIAARAAAPWIDSLLSRRPERAE